MIHKIGQFYELIGETDIIILVLRGYVQLQL